MVTTTKKDMGKGTSKGEFEKDKSQKGKTAEKEPKKGGYGHGDRCKC